MSSPQVPDPTAGTIYEPTIHRHAYLMLSHLAGYPVLTSEDKLRNSAESNHRYINYNLEDQQGFHTIASIAKKCPDKIHAITSVAKERPHLPLVSLTGDLSGQMVTFLADTGRSTSIIRPQDLPCSCKECTEAVESEGIPIEVNGTIVKHPFTVSSEWPLSILGHDLLSKLKSVWMLLHLGIQADAVRKMHKAPPEPVVEEQTLFRIR